MFIHHTAIIYPGVIIEQGAYIGEYCVIGSPPEWKGYEHNEGLVLIMSGARLTGLVTVDSGTDKRTTVLYQILDDKSMINFKKMQNGFTQLLSYVEGNNHNMISQVTKQKEVPQHIVALIEQYHEYKV